MIFRKEGIARSVIAVAVIVIIAVAAAGVYLASSPGGAVNTSTRTSSTQTSSTSGSSPSSTTTSTSSSQSRTSTSVSSSTSLTCSTSSTTSSTTTTTSTTPNSASAPYHSLVELFGNFSAMNVNSRGNTQNSSSGYSFSYNANSTYEVLSSPKTGSSVYKVNFTENYSKPPETGIMWMETNGTIMAIEMSGHNSTGAAAVAEAGLLSFSFPSEYFYGVGLQSYLSLPGVHQINQTSLTLGPTTLTVTNYGITSPSSFCNGNGVISYTKFQLQAGKVPGTTATLVPLWSNLGSFTPSSGKGISYSSTVQVISVTKA